MRTLAAFLVTVLAASTPLLAGPSRAATAPRPTREGVWPLQPRPEVAAGFDPPATRWGPGHRGADLVGQVGQPVRTSLGGAVTFAAPLAGRGVVVVDHGAVRTTYEPVRASVTVGQVLASGAVVGTLRRAGSHCFPRACLHWGLLRGERYLNPLVLVGAGPIRLLPLSGDRAPAVVEPRAQRATSRDHARAPHGSIRHGPARAV
jgi:murein DD-endopeptidase MepM/ murein hydrolase activator NlpD